MENKRLSKIGAIVLCLAMLLGSAPAVLAETTPVEATNGYFWLEGEDGVGSGEWNVGSNTNNSNGLTRVISTQSAAPAGGNRLDYSINVTEAGTYKAYVYGTVSGNEWLSASKLYIDDVEVSLPSATGSNWSAPYCYSWRWGKVVLSAGTHTVSYRLTAPRTHDNSTYVGCMDYMCIMPQDYAIQTVVGSKPVAPTYAEFTNGYFWAEERAAIADASCTTVSNALFSEGSAFSNEVTVSAGTKHSFTYFVNVPKTADYLLALNGSLNGNVWQSTIKVAVDDTNYTLSGTGASNWVGSMQCSWNSAIAPITQGKHKITILIDGGSVNNSTLYKYAIDALCISESDFGWIPSISTKPVQPVWITNAWLEESDANSKNSGLQNATNTSFSGGAGLQCSQPSGNGTNGYYADFSAFMGKTDDYDIYFRSNVDNEWMSAPSLLIDGVAAERTKIMDEGWIGGYTIGWNKATVNMTEGKHTIRWTLIASRTASTNTWIGEFDCLVILPKGSAFTPLSGDTVTTKLDYELSALLAGTDTANISDDIVLPTQTESGATVTWTSNNTAVIANDGTVSRSVEGDINVTLTATCGEYAKAFPVTVKQLTKYDVTSFDMTGNVTAGATVTANATLKYNLGTSKKVMLIIALYNADHSMIVANLDSDEITAAGTDLSASITVPEDITAGTYARAYLWNYLDDLQPIMSAISK